MSKWFGTAVIAATGVCLLATAVPAQVTDPNKDEQKCEAGAGKAITKFVGSKSKCISKCFATARKTSGPYTGCFEPGYTDPTTNTCINDPVKGAEAKGGAAVAKGCAVDCPECYSAAECNDGTKTNPWIVTTEGDVDAPFGPGTGFPSLIYCIEKAGNTPTKDEAKCEDGVVKALVKFTGSKQKCYAKCFANFYKGKIPGGCNPPATDPATVTCISDPTKGAEAKAKAAIVKACTVAVPGCYSGGATGAANTFVGAVEAKVDQRTPQIACGSPSGAFLE
jgi:hypothetical protein